MTNEQLTWTCPNCLAVFYDQQAMKDHVLTNARRLAESCEQASPWSIAAYDTILALCEEVERLQRLLDEKDEEVDDKSALGHAIADAYKADRNRWRSMAEGLAKHLRPFRGADERIFTTLAAFDAMKEG